MKFKICGMREKENIRLIASQQPDYMGFIFYAASPRFVGNDFVVPDDLPSTVVPVGVFVNEEVSVIESTARRAGFKTVQLHGSETPDQCLALKEKGYTVIKVFSVDDAFDFAVTEPYKSVADYFLFDTKGKYHGGNAKTFDWKILERYDQQVPFFLSGGLSPENIAQIHTLKAMNLYALDANSGVEESPARKDPEKVKKILSYKF